MYLVYSLFTLPYIMFLLTAILSICMYVKSWLRSDEERPSVLCKDSPLAAYLLKKCHRLYKPFSPPVLLENRHIQTILPSFAMFPDLEYEREYIQLRDKGVVALDWVIVPKSTIRKKSTILLIIPQVTRDATSVSSICISASKRNVRTVVFNRRGEGNSLLTTPRLRSYGDPSDLRQAVKYINGRYPGATITCISYGTGSELLLSYLGEYNSGVIVSACVCISPCFDPASRFGSTLRSIYDILYLIRLKLSLCRLSKALCKNVDIHKALGSWRFDNYNETLYCKTYGYDNIAEFWERNDPLRGAVDISTPVLCISSKDDPFYPNIDVPQTVFTENQNLFMLSCEKGGHCGFVEDVSGNSWADDLSLDFIDSILEFSVKGYSVKKRHLARSTI